MRPSWKSSPVENYVFSKVETIIPILTDNRPTIHVLPRDPEFSEYAEHIHNLLGYHWDRLNMDDIVLEATKNSLIFGKGFYYTYWDYDIGDIACESVDPQNIFVDPMARSIKKCRYLVHVARMSVWDIINQWPDAAGKVEYGAQTVEEPSPKTGWTSLDRVSVHAGAAYADPSIPTGRVVPWVGARLDDVGQPDAESVQVLQFWIRDPSVTREPLMSRGGEQMTDAEGNKLFLENQKYPGGRHIVLAGDTIIHDGPNPFLHGEFPYVEQDCHKVPGEFWCVSVVQNLISPQMELNKALGQVIDNKNLMGNAQWVVSSDAGIKADQITAKPGLVIVKTRGSEVERVSPEALPSYIQEFIEGRKRSLDDISGVYDTTQGRKPTGITAGVAIESLQEAAATRLRALVRNLENAVRNVGQQWVGVAQQFYEDAKMVRVTDPDTGEFTFDSITPEMIQAQWEVQVAAGSTLPRSREVRQGQAVELFQLGVFDEEALLEWIQHPGRDKLLARIRARQEKALELAERGVSMNQALGGPPAGPLAALGLGPMGQGVPGAQGPAGALGGNGPNSQGPRTMAQGL